MKIVNNSNQLKEEIWNNHFMSYEDYSEIKLTANHNEDSYCYRCNNPLQTLTYLDPDFYYIPCWNCVSKKKTEQLAMTEGIIRNIKDFYNKITGDRYFQLFIVDDIYFRTTFPHDYSVFKKVVNSLDPPSRNDIWFLDWLPGYPKTISLENLPGIKIVNLTRIYPDVKLEKNKIKVGEFEISLPEISTTDIKHQSRYSLFSNKSDRRTKRLKLGDKYIKFYNTEDENVKSLFKLTKNGEEVSTRSITKQDFVVIKLAIMRDKAFLKLIFDVILEALRYSGTLKDTIFLKNTVLVDPKKEDTVFNLIWTINSKHKNNNYINISII